MLSVMSVEIEYENVIVSLSRVACFLLQVLFSLSQRIGAPFSHLLIDIPEIWVLPIRQIIKRMSHILVVSLADTRRSQVILLLVLSQ